MEFTVKIRDKEHSIELRSPNFKDYRMAHMAANFGGEYDMLGAGSSLIQHCWVKGDETIKNGDSDDASPEISQAYMTLAIEVYNDIFLRTNVEIKKK